MAQTGRRDVAGNGGGVQRNPADGGGDDAEIGGLPRRSCRCAASRWEREARRCCRQSRRSAGGSRAPAASGATGARVSVQREIERGRGSASEGERREGARRRGPHPREGGRDVARASRGSSARLCLLAEVEERKRKKKKKKGIFKNPLEKKQFAGRSFSKEKGQIFKAGGFFCQN